MADVLGGGGGQPEGGARVNRGGWKQKEPSAL